VSLESHPGWDKRVPIFSVVLVSYNRPHLVTDAIRSMFDQTFENWELIVADDDSNDMTKGAIIGASDHDPRVRVLLADAPVEDRRSRLRYCVRINEALAHVRGAFIAYFLDDDYLYPRALQAHLAVYEAHPEAHVTYGRLRSISYDAGGPNRWDTNGRPLPGRSFPAYGEFDPAIGKVTNDANWEPGVWSRPIGGHIDHNQVAHRRECLAEMGGPPWWPEGPTSEVGDAMFFKRLDGLGHKAHSVDEFVVTKRFHGLNYGKAEGSPVRE